MAHQTVNCTFLFPYFQQTLMHHTNIQHTNIKTLKSMILHGQRMAGIIAQLTAAARKRKGKKEITSAKCIHSLEVMKSKPDA